MAFSLIPDPGTSPLFGYGPRQPQTIGVRGIPGSPTAFMGAGSPSWLPKSLGGTGGVPQPPGAPTYHTYTPAKGKWTLPPGHTLVWVPGKGYTSRPGGAAGGAAGAPGPPTDPWTAMLTKLMGSYETPEQQEARANREVDAQIAANKKMLDDEYQRQQRNAQAMYQAQAAAGSAAAAMSGDLFGAVGGEFNAAAGEIKGLSHGLTGGVGKQTGKDIAAANAGMMPGNVAVEAGGDVFSPGGGLQQGVEDYRAGTLGGQLFSGLGEAANFGLAGMASSDNLRATQEANAALMKSTQDINDAQSKAISALAAGRGDLYHQYMADAQDAQIKRLTLAQGIQAAQAASDTKPITKLVGGNLMQWIPGRGWIKAVAGDAGAKATAKTKAQAAKDALPNSALSKVYGHVVDSKGNMIPGADGKAQPVASTAAAGVPKANVQLSRAVGKWVDANGVPIPSLNRPGTPKPPPFFKPGDPKSKKAVTKETKDAGWQEIRDHQLLVRAQQKLAKYNAKQIAAGVERRKGVSWKDDPMTIDELSQLSPDWKADIGLTDAEAKAAGDPRTLQETYIDLVHSGIPARDAWLMIRKYYPKFGANYFH